MVLEIHVVPFYCSSFVHSSGIIAIDCYVLFSEDLRHTIVLSWSWSLFNLQLYLIIDIIAFNFQYSIFN